MESQYGTWLTQLNYTRKTPARFPVSTTKYGFVDEQAFCVVERPRAGELYGWATDSIVVKTPTSGT